MLIHLQRSVLLFVEIAFGVPHQPKLLHTVSLTLHMLSSVLMGSTLDHDLRDVLELASDAELHELANILYGQSLLSPLLKSITRGDGSHKKFDAAAEGREALVDRLESRFLYLGADAKETLRGRRPSYRDILLGVRARLDVHCSEKLSTEDLEVEIFLHLLQHNTREGTHWSSSKHQFTGTAERVNPMGQYSKNWHVAFKLGGGELLKVLIKGGGVFSASLFQRMVARRLGGESSCRNGSLPNSKRSFEEGWSSSSFKLAKTSSNACSKTGSCWSCVILCHFAKHLYALWTTVSSHIIFHLV
ncbi:hypothetical protein KP509_1Z076800 [Ceratopteris richardii]|nr:hypothetical protein KP509_1Z076800 [Ceratopteris richardii]